MLRNKTSPYWRTKVDAIYLALSGGYIHDGTDKLGLCIAMVSITLALGMAAVLRQVSGTLAASGAGVP